MVDKLGFDSDITRINYNDNINYAPNLKNKVDEKTTAGEKPKDIKGIQECQTCKNRTYQDGSDDPGVSFKSPTKMSPEVAASQVLSHEMEHYNREAAKAEQDGREVIKNDVQIFTSVCPECGKTYVSGGLTTTQTRKKAESAEFAKDFFDKNVGIYMPKEFDKKV